VCIKATNYTTVGGSWVWQSNQEVEVWDWNIINHDKSTVSIDAFLFDENLRYGEQFKDFFILTLQKQKIPLLNEVQNAQ